MLERIRWQSEEDFQQTCVDSLKDNGWWFSRGSDTEEAFAITDFAEWINFSNHWNRLLLDEYMRDGGTYRYRRYSSFEFDVDDSSLTLLPHAPYVQSAAINTLNGGFERHFNPLEQSFVEHPVLKKILKNLGSIVSETADHNRWNIKLHPYRIIASEDTSGEPAPEGLHQDGVDYIVSYMINRENVTGGISVVTDNEKEIMGDVEMSRPNDFIIGNDRNTYHGVSSVLIDDAKKPFAYRDVLVIAFEKI